MVTEGILKIVLFVERFEGREGGSYKNIWVKSNLDRENCRCKGFEGYGYLVK